ncbi:hypothetical protein HKD37_20G057010 [Glycine soja]
MPNKSRMLSVIYAWLMLVPWCACLKLNGIKYMQIKTGFDTKTKFDILVQYDQMLLLFEIVFTNFLVPPSFVVEKILRLKRKRNARHYISVD